MTVQSVMKRGHLSDQTLYDMCRSPPVGQENCDDMDWDDIWEEFWQLEY